MGRYINQINGKLLGASAHEKKMAIMQAGGIPIQPPTEFIPNLVCVVDNGFFAAAGYAFSEQEMNAFNLPDQRPKQWFLLKNAASYAE